MRSRTFYLDNVCCILILRMIFSCHASAMCGGYSTDITNFINETLFFFMSWFFFKGGMMHKFSQYETLLKKSTSRLLFPYLFFILVGLIVDFVIYYVDVPNNSLVSFMKQEVYTLLLTSTLKPTQASWFLVSLFVARLVFNFIGQKISSLLIVLISITAAYGVFLLRCRGWIFNMYDPEQILIFDFPSFFVGNMFHGLALYSLGYYLKERQFRKWILAISIFIIVLRYFVPAGIDIRANESDGANFVLAVVYGMAGCIIINNLFMRLVNCEIPVITYMGKNSMLYYLVHYPVMYFIVHLLWQPVEHESLMFRFFFLAFWTVVSLAVAEIIFRKKTLRVVIGG